MATPWGLRQTRAAVQFQLLTHRIVIDHDDDRLAGPLRFLRGPTDQAVAPVVTTTFTVTGTGPYEIAENGDRFLGAVGPEDVVYLIFRRTYLRIHDYLATAGWWALHAATVTVAGRRLALVGAKGTGKTTLACAFLLAGDRADGSPDDQPTRSDQVERDQVDGDEILFLRGDGAFGTTGTAPSTVPLPRPLHLKEGTFEILPRLRDLGALPSVGGDGARVTALEPSRFGYGRRLSVAPLDAVLILGEREPTPVLDRVGTGEALPTVLAQTFDPPGGAAVRARQVVDLLQRVPVHRLTPGPPAETVVLVRQWAAQQAARGAEGSGRSMGPWRAPIAPCGVPWPAAHDAGLRCPRRGTDRGDTVTMSEMTPDEIAELADLERRSFIKKVAIGAGFAIPTVASFTMTGFGVGTAAAQGGSNLSGNL